MTSEAGNVALALASGPGGILGGPLIVPLTDGIAMVTGLTLNRAGSYTLEIGDNGLAAAVSNSVDVTAPPTIVSEQVLTTGKGKHKKSVVSSCFSATHLTRHVRDAANYTVTGTVKRGRKTTANPVRLTAVYNASANSVSLILVGRPPFTSGGQIVVNAATSSRISISRAPLWTVMMGGVPGKE